MMKYKFPLSIFLFVLPASLFLGYIPVLIPLFFVASSLLTYGLYAKDKAAARRGEWRISENTLHVFSLFFGWPGALIAQQRLRHKTQKRSFRAVFWLTLIINLGGFTWVHSPSGTREFQQVIHSFDQFVAGQFDDSRTTEIILLLTKFHFLP